MAKVLRGCDDLRDGCAGLGSVAREHVAEGMRAEGREGRGGKGGVDDLAHGFRAPPRAAREAFGGEARVRVRRDGGRGEYLMRLAMEQAEGDSAARAILEIFGTPVTANELGWIEAIRELSDHSDPRLTTRSRAALRAMFGK